MSSVFLDRQVTVTFMDEIKDYGTAVNFNHGTSIVTMGQNVDRLILIENGYVKYIFFSDNGEAQMVYVLSEGSFVGEIPYFYGGKNANYTVEAMTGGSYRFFSRCVLPKLFVRDDFRTAILRSISEKIKLHIVQIRTISLLRPEQRILRVLYEAATKFGIQQEEGVLINFRLTEQDIADLSGCSLETVNRVTRKARACGIISRQGRKILVQDLQSCLKGEEAEQ